MSRPISYADEKGAHRLADFEECPTDDQFAALARSTALKRSGCDPYDVVHFAKRAAVRALRESAPSWCEVGITALGQVELTRIDPRDVRWSIALVRHAVEATSADPYAIWLRAVERAPNVLSPILREFLGAGGALSDWGYRQVSTENGPGLMPWGYAHFEPSVDLVGSAQRLARDIDAGRYATTDPEGGGGLPPAWFEPDQSLERRLAALRGVVTIHGSRRPRSMDEAGRGERLIVFVAEATVARHAGWLQARARHELTGRHVIALSRDRLLALVIAGSFEMGVASVESRESLQDIVEAARTELEILA